MHLREEPCSNLFGVACALTTVLIYAGQGYGNPVGGGVALTAYGWSFVAVQPLHVRAPVPLRMRELNA